MSNKVKEKIVFAAQVTVSSPLCVSNGEGEYTDCDVMRDYTGKPFVPGSSLAGAMRGYVSQIKADTELFGIDGKESRMSPLRVSDLLFTDVKVGTRDGVKLENKLAVDKSKYDMEVLETAGGYLFLELTVREHDFAKKGGWLNSLYKVFSAIEVGDICFGGNKTRGFGRIHIEKLFSKVFDASNLEEWLEYKKEIETLTELKKELWFQPQKDELFQVFRVPLKLTGGISIRKYSTKPGEPDYEHITYNGTPIVPGTSWNGAIRQQCQNLLKQMGHKKPARAIQDWFGFVEESDACQSQVVISESEISGGEALVLTRNKINRFDASTVEEALYTEKSHFEGTTELVIKIRKTAPDFLAICGLVLLVIKDIENGYLAIGGQTAVGRGIFHGNTSKDGEGYISEAEFKTYMSALYEFVKREEVQNGSNE